jgi:signal transduction histidine kinase
VPPDGDGERTWFLRRTRQILGATALALTDAAGALRAGQASRGPGWITQPIEHSSGERLGELHVLPGPDWRLEERSLALRIAAGAAAELLTTGQPRDTAEVGVAITLAEIALAAPGYAAMLIAIAAAIAPVVDVEKIGIAVWNDELRYLQSLPRSFGSDDAMAASSQIEPSDPHSGAAKVWRTGRTVWSNAPEHDMPDQREWVEAFGIRQLLSTPLALGGRTFGVLHLANHRTGFSSESVRCAEAVAPFVASCVATVRHRMNLRRNEALSAAVAESTTAIALGHTLEHTAKQVFPDFCRLAEVRRLAVSFGAESTPRVLVRDDHDERDDTATLIVPAALEREFLDDATAAWSARRTLVHRPEAAGDAGWSAMHLPVVAAGNREATLSVLRVPGTPFSADEIAAVGRLANVVALASVTERYHEERASRERIQERQRIADDLHDRVAQALFAGEVVLQSVLEDLEPGSVVEASISHARDLLVRSETSLREAIHQLSTTARQVDVVSALRGYTLDVEHEFGVSVELSVGKHVLDRAASLSAATAEQLLRAARELMVNAAKHGHPGRIDVSVNVRAHRLVVTVDDDGAGFTSERREGYGLRAIRRNLQEVRGQLRIVRRQPARVAISIPLTPLA